MVGAHWKIGRFVKGVDQNSPSFTLVIFYSKISTLNKTSHQLFFTGQSTSLTKNPKEGRLEPESGAREFFPDFNYTFRWYSSHCHKRCIFYYLLWRTKILCYYLLMSVWSAFVCASVRFVMHICALFEVFYIYLRQGFNVFAGFCLFICLSV